MDTIHQWRHQYDEDRDAYERNLTDIGDLGPSLTQQHFAKDADINEIVRRFGVTDGGFSPGALDRKYYGDFSDVPDFRTALDNTREAVDRFNALPADLRALFRNDPVELWEYIQDPANDKEAIELGLLKREALPPQPPTPPATTAPPAVPTTPATPGVT